jgi:hypothetical protein
MSQVPLVISFYTENSPYQLEALNLITSCQELGIDAEIEGLPCEGSWDRNCALKPFYIRRKLMEKKRPVFWVDADAIFRKKPDFSFLNKSDLAFREMKRFSHDRRFKYAAGSLFINYTPQGIEFAEKWCDHCQQQIDKKEGLEFLDQLALLDLVERGQQVKIHPLPISNCKFFDVDAMEIEESQIVIEHFQASRRYRHWKGFGH